MKTIAGAWGNFLHSRGTTFATCVNILHSFVAFDRSFNFISGWVLLWVSTSPAWCSNHTSAPCTSLYGLLYQASRTLATGECFAVVVVSYHFSRSAAELGRISCLLVFQYDHSDSLSSTQQCYFDLVCNMVQELRTPGCCQLGDYYIFGIHTARVLR